MGVTHTKQPTSTPLPPSHPTYAHICPQRLNIQIFNGYISTFRHFLIATTSQTNSNVMGESILMHGTDPQHPHSPHRPLSHPYTPIYAHIYAHKGSKFKFLTAISSNFEHFLTTNLSKCIASVKEHRKLPLEPTYNQPSYPYTTSKSSKTIISPHIPLLPLKIQVSNGYIFKF